MAEPISGIAGAYLIIQLFNAPTVPTILPMATIEHCEAAAGSIMELYSMSPTSRSAKQFICLQGSGALPDEATRNIKVFQAVSKIARIEGRNRQKASYKALPDLKNKAGDATRPPAD